MTYEVAQNFIVNPNNDKILRLHVTYMVDRDLEAADKFLANSFLTVIVPEDVNKDRFIEQALTRYMKQNPDVRSFKKEREEYR